MSVVSMAVGATTPGGATFAVVVDTGPVRVAVADNEAMADPVFTSSEAVDAQGAAKVSITGLDPSTTYFWQVEDNGTLDTSKTGRFTTHPPLGLPASFTLGAAACAGGLASVPGVGTTTVDSSRISNHPVFATIRQQALDEGWLMQVNLGDWGYPDWSDATVESLANRRGHYDDLLAQPNQGPLWRDLPWVYVWDDHDFGPNNSDGTYPDKANAAQVYRERVPHYPLADAAGIWQSWQIGRVLCVASDVRYYRSPNTDPDGAAKTMLGAAQKTWLQNLLSNSDAKALIWFMASQWLFPDPVSGSDTWANFATERDELAAMLADTGWSDRMVMVYGDRHAAGIDSGGSNQWGGFPVLVASSLDSDTGANLTGLYDVLDDTNGRGQYGTVQVQDFGTHITVRLSAWREGNLLGSYQTAIAVDQPSVASGALLRTLAGSHRAVFEARVVTGFQTGDDPDGESVDIIGGDVLLDGAADVRGTLSLTVPGENLWPRSAGSLLAPWGNEVFVRRGVDLGAETLWTPLGYYRIDSPQQDDAPDGPIMLACSDRMAGIIDGRLLEPRQYEAEQIVGEVVADLIGDIYPDAVIAFDDDSDQQPLGRPLFVEQDRYAALLDLVLSLGKIHYWDGTGVYRVETAPELTDPVWEIHEGSGGVLLQAGRMLRREGVFNAVKVIGRGIDDKTPVSAVAFDDGPLSPTRFGGRFGRVPRFYESPLITNVDQAQSAAIAMLRRSIGFPYSVNFQTVVNSRLKPFDPVRIDTGDGRQRHVLATVRIPLAEDEPMSATTKEQSLIVIGTG